jgi:multidrug resistance efflux pump
MPDAVRLDDLILQRDLAEIRRGELVAARSHLETEMRRLEQRSADYRDYSLIEISARLAEAQERLRILASGGAQTDAIRLSLAREEVARLQAVLAAAEKGVFIAGGFNDAPYSEQRNEEAARTLNGLNAGIDGADAEIAALNRRIDQERIRVGRMATATVVAPVDGIIWERLAVSGSHVERGDAVVRLADCSNVFVTQPVFNRLRPGATATFRVDGSGEVLTGTVARLAGTSAASFYDSLAVAPSQKHLERADVLLTLPALAENPQLRCAIGVTGRAFFEVRPLDWLRSLLG